MKSTLFAVLFGISLGVGGFYIAHQKASQTSGNLDVYSQKPIIENVQAFILQFAQSNYLPIRDFGVSEPQIAARAAILVDGVSNRVLFAKNPDEELPIASITKLMTAIVIIEDMDVNAVYTVFAEDLNVDGNGPDFVQGEKLLGTELMKIMLVKSSNDAASVFASSAYRQGLDFVGLMNEKAVELGMASTHFSDPSGLNDAENYSTASDVVKLIRAASHHEYIKDVATTVSVDVPTIEGILYHIVNTDQLLRLIPQIILGKTGNTDGALGTMALAVRMDDRNSLISVILGSEDRFGETKKLIDWGKRAHKWD